MTTTKEEIAKEIGVKLRNFRNKKGLSQEKFAEVIGKQQNKIHNWESGKVLVPLEVLIIICDTWEDCDLNYFTPGKDGERPKEYVTRELFESIYAKLAVDIEQLKIKMRELDK